jgi:Mlc titration factor MtfA (ptsG expression regulator)
MLSWLKRRTKIRRPNTPFPPEWREILRERFPLYNRLSEADRTGLERLIHGFLARKRFEGCGGLKITDEIRIVIAAQACLLLLHHPSDRYEKLRSILVYPSAYFASNARLQDGGVVKEEKTTRLGESWEHGSVVLAWDAVRHGAANPLDGSNVVFHEFAHQLDQESGQADGAPLLAREKKRMVRVAAYSSWAKVLSGEYEQLKSKTARGRKTVLDKYGASHPAEFFAVATETFFEKPRQMQQKHPELYLELKQFYGQDPAAWPERPHPTR